MHAKSGTCKDATLQWNTSNMCEHLRNLRRAFDATSFVQFEYGIIDDIVLRGWECECECVVAPTSTRRMTFRKISSAFGALSPFLPRHTFGEICIRHLCGHGLRLYSTYRVSCMCVCMALSVCIGTNVDGIFCVLPAEGGGGVSPSILFAGSTTHTTHIRAYN